MTVDLSKIHLSKKEIAAELGINIVSLWRRITGRSPWRPFEIEHLKKLEEQNAKNISQPDPEI